jgi:RNA polymerase sigma factor (TIGR02999 family)
MYTELKRMARHYMRGETQNTSLQTTALVHEAWMRLKQSNPGEWEDRTHFYAVSATIMRRILLDLARSRSAAKRRGVMEHPGQTSPNVDELAQTETSAQVLALEDALTELERQDPRKARVIELRFYGGRSVEETAEALGISPQTVLRDWKLARAWLARELAPVTAPVNAKDTPHPEGS